MRFLFTIPLFIAIISPDLLAETPRPLPESAILDPVPRPLPQAILSRLSRSSAQIFSGTVLTVEHRRPDSSSSLPTTRISLRVEEAIRGVQRGQVTELKEWGGLWQMGERYRPGERVLLFLYPLSRLGLTSPVGGRTGRFPVDRAGEVLLKNSSGDPPTRVNMRTFVARIRSAENE